MKQISNRQSHKNVSADLLLKISFLFLLIMPFALFAQTDSTKKEVQADKAETSLISPSIEFISVQKGDNTVDLKATMKAKVKGTFYKLPLLKVTFVQVMDTAENVLGFVITDRMGKAVFNTKTVPLTLDKEGKLHFKAVFAGNKQMEAAEEEITFKRARLEITPVKGDSLNAVQLKLVDLATGTETPVPETALGLYVSRLFNPLKIGEGTTDENGETSIDIPADLPGDAKGNLVLLAKLDENELYGNLESSVNQKWGIPVSDKLSKMPRALWSSAPPLWMVITFIILMTTVWGHYLVIIVQLFRLRKEEPHMENTTINV